MLALAVFGQRRKKQEPRAGGHGEDEVRHLLRGLPLDRNVAVGAERLADGGVEQSQVVVDLGDGRDRRAGVLRGGLLLDRDRRREPLDRVHVGLVHLLEELARVGGERLDVAALPLGEEGVERERRLAGSRDAGDHDQPVARDVEVDVLEVVLAGAANRDHVSHREPKPVLSQPCSPLGSFRRRRNPRFYRAAGILGTVLYSARRPSEMSSHFASSSRHCSASILTLWRVVRGCRSRRAPRNLRWKKLAVRFSSWLYLTAAPFPPLLLRVMRLAPTEREAS